MELNSMRVGGMIVGDRCFGTIVRIEPLKMTVLLFRHMSFN